MKSGMMQELMDKDLIYYSHVNEDNRIERRLLANSRCNTVVAIAGSGERVLSLLDLVNCKRLKVVDINPCAIYLLQLKITALSHLSVDEYLQFIGHKVLAPRERVQQYQAFSNQLPSAAKAFWDNHHQDISNGILYAGQFEKFIARLRPSVVWFLGSGVRRLFLPGATGHLPEVRWKLLLKLFSYKIIYHLAGNKDIAFTGKNANLVKISKALDQLVTSGKASSSFITHLIFNGNLRQMEPNDLPPSLRPEVLAGIKTRLNRAEIEIEYHIKDFNNFLKEVWPILHHPVFISLSDILSFVEFNYLQNIIKKINTPGSVLVGRSFVRNRLSMQELEAIANDGKVNIHDDQESTLMYQVFSFHPAK